MVSVINANQKLDIMKNKITAILLFFAVSFAFNGLMAQTPGPVHGTKTDQEIQKEDDNSQDRTYKREETESRERPDRSEVYKKNKGNRGNKGKAVNSTCESDQKDKTAYKEERGKKGDHNRIIKHKAKIHKGEMKKDKKYFKKHPIFERRSDARNGKGEN